MFGVSSERGVVCMCTMDRNEALQFYMPLLFECVLDIVCFLNALCLRIYLGICIIMMCMHLVVGL